MSIAADTHFESHFPIPVMVSHHTQVTELNQELFGLIRSLAEKFRDSPEDNEARSGTITTYGGYQTSKKLPFLNRTEACVQRLRGELVAPGVERYLMHAYEDQVHSPQTQLTSWANILAAGDWQAPHMHPTSGNLASGVYYVQMPEKPQPEGCIEFLNPHPVSHHHGVSLTRRLYPQTGDLVIFPPYYIHYVYPFKGDGERAIVAFDVILRTTQFVF
ncbi:MAG: putative 2OG-Fe(II) oxygenase [Gammaproteobacteria bacterium]